MISTSDRVSSSSGCAIYVLVLTVEILLLTCRFCDTSCRENRPLSESPAKTGQYHRGMTPSRRSSNSFSTI